MRLASVLKTVNGFLVILVTFAKELSFSMDTDGKSASAFSLD